MYPSPPLAVAAEAPAPAAPHPWRRYFARSLDTLWYLPLSGMALAVGFTVLLSEEEAELFFDIPGVVLGLILFALWLPIEALFICRMGATPGKWLFGIRVEAADGRLLRFGQAAERALRVWFQGLGLGIPLASLITSIYACSCLESRTKT